MTCWLFQWRKKSLRWSAAGMRKIFLQVVLLVAVVSDGFDRATFEGFHALLFFFGVFGLLDHVGVASVLIARKILRRGFPAQVAVDALLIDIELACYIVFKLLTLICHNVGIVGVDWSLVKLIPQGGRVSMESRVSGKREAEAEGGSVVSGLE